MLIRTKYINSRLIGIAIILFSMVIGSYAQSRRAFNRLSTNRNLSASNYCIYPDSVTYSQTPPPEGKHPFYISHYGRHGSRYLNNRKGYDVPYQMLAKADSAGKLTPLGQHVLQQLKEIIDDSEGRWGELSELGKQQNKNIACRMMMHFPEVFEGKAIIDAKSTTVNRCIVSMASALQAMMARNPQLQIRMEASKSDMWYMNHQDKQLRDSMTTPATDKAYDIYCDGREHNPRLMSLLFNDSIYIKEQIDEITLNYYLLKTALIQQNTDMGSKIDFLDIFSYEDIHQFWQKENAWWYFNYGPSLLNGAKQPYTQRFLLRKMIEEADSCIQLRKPGAQLRFGHETIVLPLTCLLEINQFGYQTYDLEELEEKGWWACVVFPMASNIQFVFYRSDYTDKDILVKILLNEREARLPVESDMKPYYRWKDVRQYYLDKIDAYENGN